MDKHDLVLLEQLALDMNRFFGAGAASKALTPDFDCDRLMFQKFMQHRAEDARVVLRAPHNTET